MSFMPSSEDISEDDGMLSSSKQEKKTWWDVWPTVWPGHSNHVWRGSSLDNNTINNSSSLASNSTANIRYSYDVVGHVIHEVAAKYCDNSFTDWCCVSTHGQRSISQCLVNIPIRSPPTNTSAADSALDCVFLLDHYEQIYWLVDTPSPACNTDRQGRDAVNANYKWSNIAIPNYFNPLFSADNSTTSASTPRYYSVYMNGYESNAIVGLSQHKLTSDYLDPAECIDEAWQCVSSSSYISTVGDRLDIGLQAAMIETRSYSSTYASPSLLYYLVMSICFLAVAYLLPRWLLYLYSTMVRKFNIQKCVFTKSQLETPKDCSMLQKDDEEHNGYGTMR
ncbi:hypothetical protein EON65_31940 [archaeon]|nr:MAG: hypothetical protein EON65_31940 [archaeon]